MDTYNDELTWNCEGCGQPTLTLAAIDDCDLPMLFCETCLSVLNPLYAHKPRSTY